MKPRIALAVFLGVGLISAGTVAACPAQHPKKPHTAKAHPSPNGCVDLQTLPQISATIAGHEPTAPVAKGADAIDQPASPYEGPTVGLTKPNPGVFPAPTVGYKWSLE